MAKEDKRRRVEYPTFDDIKSDWSSHEEDKVFIQFIIF